MRADPSALAAAGIEQQPVFSPHSCYTLKLNGRYMSPDCLAVRHQSEEAGQPAAPAAPPAAAPTDGVPFDVEAPKADADVAVSVPALELLKIGQPAECPDSDGAADSNGDGDAPPGQEHAVLPNDTSTTKPVSYFTLFKCGA